MGKTFSLVKHQLRVRTAGVSFVYNYISTIPIAQVKLKEQQKGEIPFFEKNYFSLQKTGCPTAHFSACFQWLLHFRKGPKWQWPNSAHISYTWHALLHIMAYVHPYIVYRTNTNFYTPDSARSLHSLANNFGYILCDIDWFCISPMGTVWSPLWWNFFFTFFVISRRHLLYVYRGFSTMQRLRQFSQTKTFPSVKY